MRKISEKIKTYVVEDHLNNMSNRKIATKYNISEKSVRRILKEKKNTFSRNLGGRPTVLKPKETNYLLREFSKGSIHTSTDGVGLIKK